MARKSRKNSNVKNVHQQDITPFQTAIYVRVSVETEKKIESDTIGTQIQLLKDFVSQAPDLNVYEIYCDDDITGTNFHRPEFARMMNDIRDRKVNCVLVKDLSRLGRNFLESGEYIEKVFPFFEVRFIAVNDNVDTLHRSADIGVQLKNMANEMYAKDISKKICSTMKTMQAQGKFIGSQPPYGYRRKAEDKYTLEIDPETAPFVKEMFQKILDGYTIHRIVLDFNERGVPSPGRYKYEKGLLHHDKYKNSVWFFTTMRRMLSDCIYLGWIQNGKFQSQFQQGGAKCVKVPKKDWIIIKDAHEAIVDEDLFTKVQDILLDKNEGKNIGKYNSKGNKDNILRGKLKCGECGKSMALRKRKDKERIQFWYICPMHEHYNTKYCAKKSVKKEQLESLILTLIKKQFQLFTDAQDMLRVLNSKEVIKGKYQIYMTQIKNIERQISNYTKLKADLYMDFIEKLLTEDEYAAISQEYNQKAGELKLFLEELQKEAAKYSPEFGYINKWETLIQEYRDQDYLDRNMVEAFIDSITLYNDGRAEIVFKNRDEMEYIILMAAERNREVTRYA